MCSLRIGGRDLDIDALLRAVPLVAEARHDRGQPKSPTKPERPRYERSSVNVTVSEADFSDLGAQVTDALVFLQRNREVLRAARSFPGVEDMTLDFAVEVRDVAVQVDSFPAPLLREMGGLGIDLAVSRYPVS